MTEPIAELKPVQFTSRVASDTDRTTPLVEMPLAARTRELVTRFALRPVKSLGQNFLTDDNIARKLAGAALELSPATIIEIGPGLGALTVPLARSGARIVGYEKDKKLEGPLRELLSAFPNVELHMADFLKADLTPHLGPDTIAVGNLPYYITSPILEKLLLTQPPLRAIIITVQREVAERLSASPATREYGSLTVFCAYYVRSIEQLARLSPGVFWPQPSVASSALRLIPRRGPPPGVASPPHFFAGLRAAFGYRRKTLRKALTTAPETGLDRTQAEAVLAAAGIQPQRRGDTLTFDEFVALGNALAAQEETG